MDLARYNPLCQDKIAIHHGILFTFLHQPFDYNLKFLKKYEISKYLGIKNTDNTITNLSIKNNANMI